jgi:hypothetical protein
MSTFRIPSLNSLIFKSFFLRFVQRRQNEPARHIRLHACFFLWRNEGGKKSNISFAAQHPKAPPERGNPSSAKPNISTSGLAPKQE